MIRRLPNPFYSIGRARTAWNNSLCFFEMGSSIRCTVDVRDGLSQVTPRPHYTLRDKKYIKELKK